MNRLVMGLACVGFLVMASCSGKAPIEDAPFAAEQSAGKADKAWTNVKSLGSIEMNQNLAAAYTKTPRYRSFEFAGVQANVVDIWVRSETSDPVAYLLDEQWRVLAKNDDATSTDTSSHLTYQIETNGLYRIVFRDYDLKKGSFTVSLGTKRATGSRARAQAAYDEAASSDAGLDSFAVSLADLPKAAREWSSGGEVGCGNDAWKLQDSRGYTVWVTGCSPGEEMWVVDLFSSTGAHLAHGYSGDGPYQITYWEPTEWDPTLPH